MRKRSLLLAACIALVACGGSTASTSTSQATSGGDVPSGASVRSPPTIVVRNQGSEPRRQLRYHLTEGQTEAVTMRMRMRMHITNEGVALPEIDVPEMSADMTFGPVHVREDGAFDVPFRFNSFEITGHTALPQQSVDAIRAELRSMEGLDGSQRLDARGRVVFVYMNVPETASASMRQTLEQMQRSIDQMSFALPEEALGVGAEFDINMSIAGPPVALTQSVHVRLLAIEGDALTVETDISQTAAPQAIAGPPGADVQLLSMTGTGRSRLEIGLDHIVPSGWFAVIVDVLVRATMNASTATVGTRMEIDCEFAPRR